MRTATSLTALGLVLVACGGGESSADPSSSSIGVSTGRPTATVEATPEATVIAALDHLANHRISALVYTMAKPEELAEMKSKWAEMRKEPPSAAEDAQFKEVMSRLTAKGAEEALFAEIQPHLAEAQQQLGMMAGMAPMMAAGAIQDSGAPEDALMMVETLGQKFAQMNIASEDNAKKAISILCKAAREIDVADGAAMQKLGFDEALGKVDVAYAAVMDVLEIYGIDLSSTFNSVEIETLSTKGDRAELELTFSMFGMEPQTVPFEMERIDGRWYGVENAPAAQAEMGDDSWTAR